MLHSGLRIQHQALLAGAAQRQALGLAPCLVGAVRLPMHSLPGAGMDALHSRTALSSLLSFHAAARSHHALAVQAAGSHACHP